MKRKSLFSTSRKIALFLSLIALGQVTQKIQAANKWWKGGAGTLDNTTANFYAADATGGTLVTAVAADPVLFSAGGTFTGTYNMAGTVTYGGLTVEEGTIAITGAVTLGAGAINVNSGATLSIATSAGISTTAGSKLTLNGGTIRNTNPGINGTFFDTDTEIVLGAGGGTLSYTTANTLDIVQTATKISGSGSLTKAGAGVLAFAGTLGNATYTGATIVTDGELRIRTVANTLPITTALTVTSPGIFNLNGVNQQVGSLSGTGDVGTGSGTLTINGSVSTTFNGALKNIVNAGAGGVTTGNGKLTKAGAGVITFNGLNDLKGTVTLTAGGITVNSGAALCDAICDVVVNGGTLTLNNAAQTIENLSGTGGAITLGTGHVLSSIPTSTADTSFAGIIGGSGSFVFNKAGAKLALTAVNTYSGDTTISAGAITLDGDGSLGNGAGTLHLDGGTVNFSASRTATIPNAIDLSGDSAITTSSAAGTVNADFTSSTIGGSAGTLTFRNDGADAAGDTFKPRFSGSGFTFSRPIVIDNGAVGKTELNSYNTTGTDQTFDGIISGSGSYNRNASTSGTGGRTIFTKANTYSGGTTVSQGTLIVNNTTGSGTGSGAVTVGSNGALGGTGTISGTVSVSGKLSPGSSVGTLTTGAETWNTGGRYLWEINNAGNDLVAASGLTIAATSGSKFTIDVTALEALTGWDNTVAHTWTLASSGSSISGFSADKFTIVDNFNANNAIGTAGNFAVATSGNNLVLVFSPIKALADSITRTNGSAAQIAISSLLGNDLINAGTISFSSASATSTAGGQIEVDGTTVYYNPPAGNPGIASDTFTYTITDGAGSSSTATVTVTTAGSPQSRTLGMQTAGQGKFYGIPNTGYKIESTDSLAPENWQTLTTVGVNGIVTTDSTGLGAFSDPTDPLPSQRYYRIVVP